jgi:hypothetical protein
MIRIVTALAVSYNVLSYSNFPRRLTDADKTGRLCVVSLYVNSTGSCISLTGVVVEANTRSGITLSYQGAKRH